MNIAREINSHIDHAQVGEIQYIMDREKAIKAAIDASGSDDIVVLAGKGEDPYQKIKGVDTPYATDSKIAADYIQEIEK